MPALKNEFFDVLIMPCGVSICVHRTKLQAREILAKLAESLLFKQDWPRRREFDRHPDENKSRRKQHKQTSTAKNVKHSLQKVRWLLRFEIGIEPGIGRGVRWCEILLWI